MRLNLGAGGHPEEGYVNVDRVALPGIERVHDLDVGPWPWGAGSVSVVRAKDVFEHVNDPVLFVNECWRVLVDGGLLWIRTPHYRSPDAFTDPTHKRFLTEHSFDYWIADTMLFADHNAAYGGAVFELATFTPDGGSMIFRLRKMPKG